MFRNKFTIMHANASRTVYPLPGYFMLFCDFLIIFLLVFHQLFAIPYRSILNRSSVLERSPS